MYIRSWTTHNIVCPRQGPRITLSHSHNWQADQSEPLVILNMAPVSKSRYILDPGGPMHFAQSHMIIVTYPFLMILWNKQVIFYPIDCLGIVSEMEEILCSTYI